jgi:hypothetical protein
MWLQQIWALVTQSLAWCAGKVQAVCRRFVTLLSPAAKKSANVVGTSNGEKSGTIEGDGIDAAPNQESLDQGALDAIAGVFMDTTDVYGIMRPHIEDGDVASVLRKFTDMIYYVSKLYPEQLFGVEMELLRRMAPRVITTPDGGQERRRGVDTVYDFQRLALQSWDMATLLCQGKMTEACREYRSLSAELDAIDMRGGTNLYGDQGTWNRAAVCASMMGHFLLFKTLFVLGANGDHGLGDNEKFTFPILQVLVLRELCKQAAVGVVSVAVTWIMLDPVNRVTQESCDRLRQESDRPGSVVAQAADWLCQRIGRRVDDICRNTAQLHVVVPQQLNEVYVDRGAPKVLI